MPTASRTPGYFRVLIHLIRPFPDFDFSFIKPFRARAVGLLRLAPGARALDLGCGPGGSLPFLVEAVGPDGLVVGVEISPDVALNARRRVAHHQWPNVHIVAAPAETAELDGLFDGALMFGHLTSTPRRPPSPTSSRIFGPVLEWCCSGPRPPAADWDGFSTRSCAPSFPRISFPSTPIPDEAPWRLLAPALSDLAIEEHFFGWMFLASGTVSQP